MPYIVTTKQRVPNWDGVGDAPLMRGFRRAVATLEEARTLLIRSEHGGSLSTALLDTLPGTVGPLPDGIVIEVEQVKWSALESHVWSPFLPDAEPPEMLKAEILAAYNARQA
jgi:hypothetical protein